MRRSGSRWRQDKKRHNSAAANEGKTWQNVHPLSIIEREIAIWFP